MGEGVQALAESISSSLARKRHLQGLRLAARAGSQGDHRHILPVRVYYEDTDFSGVVYHANYLRFLERGRTDFLRDAGVDQSTLHAEGDGLIFAVRRMTIDCLQAARMDDVLVVETRAADRARRVLDARAAHAARRRGRHDRRRACRRYRRRASGAFPDRFAPFRNQSR